MIVQRESGVLIAIAAVSAIALGISVERHKSTRGDVFDETGKKYEVEPELLRAIRVVENPKELRIAVLNEKGSRDYGLMQINENTLRHYGVPEDLWLDDGASVDTAGRYMNDTRKELGPSFFNIFNWIASYNIGVPAVKAHGITGGTYTGAVYYHYLMYKLANA